MMALASSAFTPNFDPTPLNSKQPDFQSHLHQTPSQNMWYNSFVFSPRTETMMMNDTTMFQLQNDSSSIQHQSISSYDKDRDRFAEAFSQILATTTIGSNSQSISISAAIDDLPRLPVTNDDPTLLAAPLDPLNTPTGNSINTSQVETSSQDLVFSTSNSNLPFGMTSQNLDFASLVGDAQKQILTASPQTLSFSETSSLQENCSTSNTSPSTSNVNVNVSGLVYSNDSENQVNELILTKQEDNNNHENNSLELKDTFLQDKQQDGQNQKLNLRISKRRQSEGSATLRQPELIHQRPEQHSYTKSRRLSSGYTHAIAASRTSEYDNDYRPKKNLHHHHHHQQQQQMKSKRQSQSQSLSNLSNSSSTSTSNGSNLPSKRSLINSLSNSMTPQEQAKQRRLERNRIAATKWRMKKKSHVIHLENDNEKFKEDNQNLRDYANDLRNEFVDFKIQFMLFQDRAHAAISTAQAAGVNVSIPSISTLIADASLSSRIENQIPKLPPPIQIECDLE